jgi:uncharacterized membrane protein
MGTSGADEEGTRVLPTDLVVVVVLSVGVLLATLVSPVSDSPARYVFAVVAVVLPGYTLVAALFPRGPLGTDESPGRRAERVRRLDAFERTVLSLAAGLLVTPLVGIGVDFSPWPFRQVPVLAAVVGFVVVTAAVAAERRQRLPPAERYTPARRWISSLRGIGQGRPTRGYSVVTVLVAVAVVVAAGGVFTVVTTAETGEQFTEFSLLVEDDGDLLVAGSYPQAVEVGENATVVFGVENRERREQTYTVVPRLQRVVDVDNETRISEYEEYDRVRLTVGAGRTERRDYTVNPTLTGENLRLSFLLYRGDPPDRVTVTNAYRRTHIWLDVTSQSG